MVRGRGNVVGSKPVAIVLGLLALGLVCIPFRAPHLSVVLLPNREAAGGGLEGAGEGRQQLLASGHRWTPLTLSGADKMQAPHRRSQLHRFFGLGDFPGTALRGGVASPQARTQDLAMEGGWEAAGGRQSEAWEQELASKRRWQPLTVDTAGKIEGEAPKRRSQMHRFFGLNRFPGGALAAARQQELANSGEAGDGYADIGTKGYFDAGSYRSTLEKQEVAGQKKYMADWRAKGMKAAKTAVKNAAKLYKKWMLVDPNTGRSPLDMKIPSDSDRIYAVRGRQQMMMEVVGSDNGKTYKLPWWCIMVHNEAAGNGTGWDGGASPQGASGPRGIDCRPPHVVNGTAFPPEEEEAAEEQAAEGDAVA
uniref:Uncharacterized protein n=1 Tax=Hemiselmis andersenii TaxID=464988 RepID=A0A7S1HKK9_HEMAN